MNSTNFSARSVSQQAPKRTSLKKKGKEKRGKEKNSRPHDKGLEPWLAHETARLFELLDLLLALCVDTGLQVLLPRVLALLLLFLDLRLTIRPLQLRFLFGLLDALDFLLHQRRIVKDLLALGLLQCLAPCVLLLNLSSLFRVGLAELLHLLRLGLGLLQELLWGRLALGLASITQIKLTKQNFALFGRSRAIGGTCGAVC